MQVESVPITDRVDIDPTGGVHIAISYKTKIKIYKIVQTFINGNAALIPTTDN